MKRLLLLIGLGLIIWGILGLNELQRQRNSIPERPGYGIPEKEREIVLIIYEVIEANLTQKDARKLRKKIGERLEEEYGR